MNAGKPFAKRLRSLRKAAGLTQAALGKALGIHPVCISQYEAAVNVPREERKAAILAYFEQGEAPAVAPEKKKRGRPRKVKPEVEKSDQAEAPDPPKPEERKRVKWGRPKKVAEVIEQKVVVERREQVESAAVKTPVRLGEVSRDWIEAQIASFVHARAVTLMDGQAIFVTIRQRDLIDLGQTLIEACGTKVGEE